ncbi:MAG: phosphoribosylaminoimidazolesuccinocarboxamide synthase [Phycisphaerales bacterium]
MTIDHGMLQSSLSLPGLRRGKVRDVYDLPPDRLLIVATDRISAFDVVMPTPIPGKGRLLTELSSFWLGFIESCGICRTHLVSTNVDSLPTSAFAAGGSTPDDLRGRITIAHRAKVVPIECVVRGYLEGSGWKEYQATGQVCGVPLPRGLRQCDRLPEPIFTPATKEELGAHDQNITFDQAAAIAGRETMEWLRATSLRVYEAASEHARARGVIIADTKFEFGWIESGGGRELILVDEALTPDSSRFWPLDGYEPGHAQKSFDKQFLREWLEALVAKGEWNKQAPGPSLPAEIAEATLTKYREATRRLSGEA